MPRAEFFERFGFLIVRGFLEPEFCSRVVAEMEAAPHRPGQIMRVSDGGYAVDEQSRKVEVARVLPSTEWIVRDRFLQLMPAVAARFSVRITSCQPPQFLAYGPGGRFERHRDAIQADTVTEELRERLISCVVFLNQSGQGDATDSSALPYQGGKLSFYELMSEPPWDHLGFPLEGEPGLLVAFPASLPHEVTEITGGRRFTIAFWFT